MLGQILPVVGQAWAQSGVVCVDIVIFFPLTESAAIKFRK